MFEIVSYTPDRQDEWNRFVAASKNGTFLFDRRYMDYHSDRFSDHSLMVCRDGGLYALLPACVEGDMLLSHAGLTYGGLVMSRKCSGKGVVETFKAINAFLREEDIKRVVYKAVPWIYHQVPAEEDLYALTNVCHARLTIRDISSTIVEGMRFAESRRSGIRKALRRGLTVSESTDFEAFWQILDTNLTRKYGTHPVHTVAEMQLLHDRFPRQIRLFMTFDGDHPLGGTVVFLTPQVLHTQYISASEEGKAVGAIDLLFDHLVHSEFPHYRYIDFGKSTSTDSALLNEQLLFQKEGFGGRGVCYDTYEYDL